MESSRFVDFYGLLEGHSIETNDGVLAYTQVELKDVTIETWVRLDRDFRPKHFDNYRDPVVPLKKALYGHPDSGGHWEDFCTEGLVSVGFEAVPDFILPRL